MAEAIKHSFVLNLEAGCRLPVCQGPSVGFMLSASALQSCVMRSHFLHALTPLVFMLSRELLFRVYTSREASNEKLALESRWSEKVCKILKDWSLLCVLTPPRVLQQLKKIRK